MAFGSDLLYDSELFGLRAFVVLTGNIEVEQLVLMSPLK